MAGQSLLLVDMMQPRYLVVTVWSGVPWMLMEVSCALCLGAVAMRRCVASWLWRHAAVL